MKVAITGKGGVGKTTLSSTLARLYADEGRTVLAADVDPDANLGLALGLSQEEVDAIVPISKMRTLVEERTGANEANNQLVRNVAGSSAHGDALSNAALQDGTPGALGQGNGADGVNAVSDAGFHSLDHHLAGVVVSAGPVGLETILFRAGFPAKRFAAWT